MRAVNRRLCCYIRRYLDLAAPNDPTHHAYYRHVQACSAGLVWVSYDQHPLKRHVLGCAENTSQQSMLMHDITAIVRIVYTGVWYAVPA